MLTKTSRLTLATCALALVATFPISGFAQDNKFYRVEVGGAGTTSHIFITVMTGIWAKELGAKFQVNDGQTITRSVLKLARGEIDLIGVPPPAYGFMKKGARMYKRVKDAKEVAPNIRSLMGFNNAATHYIVWADSGIKTFADLKGKRIYTGPPSGAAAVQAEDAIRIVAGLEPKKDYDVVRLPWGGGLQAMQDGKLDLYVRPLGVGGALIDSIGAKREFRLLDLKGKTDSDAFKKFIKAPGRTIASIPANTYKGQVNQTAVTTNGINWMYVVNKSMSDDEVYNFTKTMWNNVEKLRKTAVVLKSINIKTPFVGVIAPLHPGAVKYYKEVGVEIPKRLLPPTT
jgi:TRAP transporter TAXI family solute receptor